MRVAAAAGLVVVADISPAPDGCQAAHDDRGAYSADDLPTLPLADCALFPRCTCAFVKRVIG